MRALITEKIAFLHARRGRFLLSAEGPMLFGGNFFIENTRCLMISRSYAAAAVNDSNMGVLYYGLSALFEACLAVLMR